MSEQRKRKISARDAAKDIRSGMPVPDLMRKYGLSEAGVRLLLDKLVDAGVLRRDEVGLGSARGDSAEGVPQTCPACGAPNRGEGREWPNCGAIRIGRDSARGGDSQTAGRGKGRSTHSMNVPAGHGEHSAHRTSDETLAHEIAPRADRRTRSDSIGPPLSDGRTGYNGIQDLEETGADEVADSRPEPRSLEKSEWLMVLLTPIGALLCFAFFWFRWTLQTFTTLVHEMGHAIFGWLFGYPSLPAFDLIWGGGVTVHIERSPLLLIVIYIGLAGLVYLYRNNRATVVVLLVLIALHALFSYTSIHSVIILFMGHGTELIIAGLFIYRCLSGRAVVHRAERPLYGIIGFFILFSDLSMAYGLLSSASYRREYLDAKGGDLEMDFIRIARDHIHSDMTSVVFVFLMCCIATLVLSFLAFRYMEYIHSAVAGLLTRDHDHA